MVRCFSWHVRKYCPNILLGLETAQFMNPVTGNVITETTGHHNPWAQARAQTMGTSMGKQDVIVVGETADFPSKAFHANNMF